MPSHASRPILRATFGCMTLFTTSTALEACSVEQTAPMSNEPSEVKTIQQPLYRHTAIPLWGSEETIPLCWYTPLFAAPVNGPDWEDEKAFIIHEIEKSWLTVSKVRVNWQNFGSCGPTSTGSHVRVKLVASDAGLQFISNGIVIGGGRNALQPDNQNTSPLTGADYGMGFNVAPDWNTSEEKIARFRRVIVHEFGHLLGFEHEQDRPDWGSVCAGDQDNGDDVLIGPPDGSSIMTSTYCNGVDVLSGGDIRGVRAVYGPCEDATTGACGPRDTGYSDPSLFQERLTSWCTQPGGVIGTGDFNGDHFSDLYCHDPLNGSAGRTWVALARSDGSGFFNVNWTPWLSNWCGTAGSTFGVADLDGNGKTDFWCHDPQPGSGRTWVARSGGAGVIGDVWTPWLSGWCGLAGETFSLADVSGDGRADFVCREAANHSGRVWVARTNTTGTGITGDVWTPWLNGWCGLGEQFGTADFTGEGRADFFCHEVGGQTRVAQSGGTAIIGDKWTPWITSWCGESQPGGQTFGVADFNADGRADVWCHDSMDNQSQGRTWVSLSTGSKFAADWIPWLSGWCGQFPAQFGVSDFNRDNRADLWCHDSVNTYTAISYGSWFQTDSFTPKISGWCTDPASVFLTADVTRDGAADFICHDPPVAGNPGRVWVAKTSVFYEYAAVSN